MTQHTQGPWNVAKPNCGLGIFDENGKSVAAISPTQKRPWAEKEANARLIAAASRIVGGFDIGRSADREFLYCDYDECKKP